MFRLDNKIAVVTGAGSGIGKAIASTFASVGARVFVLEANLDAGTAAVEKIRQAGGQADAIACDVAKIAGYLVEAPMPAAHEKHSNPAPLKFVVPPNPCHRPTGTKASNSIASPSCASAKVLGQSASRTPSIVVIAQPPLKFVQKVASFILRSL